MDDSKSPSQWLRLSESRECLRVSDDTVRRWADAGHIRTVRTPGGQRRFFREDVEAIARDGSPAAQPMAQPA